ncbi:DUF6568 family protein [Xylocopilactobacillus apis]|uniref:Bacteriocin transport accessory protein n=1 Tax=Xylocopilactobacillus apis TaxID=2932183 RepID=A0AAU9DG35_9LACO|nr:DUF6568 family protein [Xylocopilactobacillus apis]BDR55677.1 hypothetical protein KIMC2_02390 [Xylocopilactobacillus apis]
MKRKNILLIALAVLVVFVGFWLLRNKFDSSSKESIEETYPAVYDNLNSITVDKFKKMVKNKKEFIVYVGRPNCPDCSFFENDFLKFLKRNKFKDSILYLNVSQVHEKKNEWNTFKKKYDIKYTPTLAKYKGGKLTEKNEWTPEKGLQMQSVKKWVKKNVSVE